MSEQFVGPVVAVQKAKLFANFDKYATFNEVVGKDFVCLKEFYCALTKNSSSRQDGRRTDLRRVAHALAHCLLTTREHGSFSTAAAAAAPVIRKR